MALNKFMHPNNPYRTPPDFKTLAIEYPEFRKHVQQDLSGKVRLDFKDDGAVRALTEALLHKDFSLDVRLPHDRLVPTLPLRLNYLLWIEDILNHCGLADKPVTGIDIGTGASCIYPLLAAKKFSWSVMGTEIDEQSVECARANVERNNLSDKIEVKKVEDGTILAGVLDEGKVYDFCMCNPPFFSDPKEVKGPVAGSRPPPKNAPTGSLHELVAEGGEVAFIATLIKDSSRLRQSVRIYTTMVGHKSHLSSVKRGVRECGARSMTSTELCQGRTIRWVVGWTFMPDIDLTCMENTCGLPNNRLNQNRPPLCHTFSEPSTLDEVKQKLEDVLTQLEITIMMTSLENTSVGMTVVAHKNTWSHQRRARRHNKRTEHFVSDDGQPAATLEVTQDSTARTSRLLESGEPAAKRAKTEEPPTSDSGYESCTPLMVAILIVAEVAPHQFRFELTFVEGSGGREATNQVLQYLKNRFK